jgi:hypothetical protein
MAFCTKADGERVAAADSATARRSKRENTTLIRDIAGSGHREEEDGVPMPEPG